MNRKNQSKTLVAIIAFFGDKWLNKCLISLTDEGGKILLSDNNGNHQIEKYNPFVDHTIKTPRALGFAEANNHALTSTAIQEDFIIFLNQDTISQKGWIKACEKQMEENPTLGAVSPYIRNYDDTNWDPSFLDCFPGKKIPETPLKCVPFIPAAAMMVKKEVLQKTGPFDPIYGSYYEDYDLCYRIRKVGYEVAFCPEAIIQHYSGSTTDTPEKESKRRRMILRNKSIFQIRSASKNRLFHFLLIMFLDFPYRLARGFAGTGSSQKPKEVIDAWMDLWKIADRLVSKSIDDRKWQIYLRSIQWENFGKN